MASLYLSPGAETLPAGTILCDLIRKYEGCRLKAYRCPAGVPTIGWGSTGADVVMGLTWTQAQADSRLERDAAAVMLQALKSSPILAGHPRRLAAIADFIYNLGLGRYQASTLRRRVNLQDWAGAAEQLPLWVWAGGKKLPGLMARRTDEAQLMRG